MPAKGSPHSRSFHRVGNRRTVDELKRSVRRPTTRHSNDDQATNTYQGGPHRKVLNITELPRKESETIVETIFDSINRGLPKRRKDRDPRLWQLPHQHRRGRVGRNPKTRRKSRSAGEENSLLQTQQGAEGFVNNSRPRPPRRGRTKQHAPSSSRFNS